MSASPEFWIDRTGPDGEKGTPDDCVALDFDGPGVSTSGTLAAARAPFIDPLGLQLAISSSGATLDYYGPPTSGPLPFTLTPANGILAPEFRLEISVNGSGLTPDVYSGEVTFTSLDGGSPPVEETVEVLFDYCRQKTIDLALPANFSLGPSGGEHTHGITVPLGPGATIEDIDVVVVANENSGPADGKPPFGFILRSPEGVEVEINDHNSNTQSDQFLYDDTTNPGFEQLSLLEGSVSAGPWTLIFKNADAATEAIDVTLSRFELRIHHENVTICTQ